MSAEWLAATLAALPAVSVAVCGDFCVDAYWELDGDCGESSLETGLPVQRVRAQRYGLGGAGNVVANLVDLGVGRVRAIGIVGADPFAAPLLRLLGERGTLLDGSMIVDAGWQTLVYAKPIEAGVESRRLDFGGCSEPGAGVADALAGALEAAAVECQVVVLNQQVPLGVMTPALIARINGIIARHPRTLFLADSRHRPGAFAGAALKLNCVEAARLAGEPGCAPGDAPFGAAEVRSIARRLVQRTGRCAIITRGERGIVAADATGVVEVPGIQIPGSVDPVGAGDTVVAAVAAVLASRGSLSQAATFANIAAMITTRKLQTTGTATPSEILAAGAAPDYIHSPELAASIADAHYAGSTRIELVDALPEGLDIRACIFDHDGTLSTLRAGWEGIMEEMMLEAIFRGRAQLAAGARLAAIRAEVRRFIDQSAGLQTLSQMQWLAATVRSCGFVADGQVLDAAGYKALFARQLSAVVGARLREVRSGAVPPDRYEVGGATRLLRKLDGRGVRLYLVSGTDQADLVAEAQALGYADVFAGRITGAVGDLSMEPEAAGRGARGRRARPAGRPVRDIRRRSGRDPRGAPPRRRGGGSGERRGRRRRREPVQARAADSCRRRARHPRLRRG